MQTNDKLVRYHSNIDGQCMREVNHLNLISGKTKIHAYQLFRRKQRRNASVVGTRSTKQNISFYLLCDIRFVHGKEWIVQCVSSRSGDINGNRKRAAVSALNWSKVHDQNRNSCCSNSSNEIKLKDRQTEKDATIQNSIVLCGQWYFIWFVLTARSLSLSVIKMNKSSFISSKSEMKPYHSNCSHFVCRRLSWNFIYGLAAYLHSFLLSADKARCGCIECGHPHNESHGRQFNPIHVTIISIFTFFYYI